MQRLILNVLIAFGLLSAASAQTAVIASDSKAISLANSSVAAMTDGASVADATLNATVTRIEGSDYETGTGTFYVKGTDESRVDLDLDGGMNSEVRTTSQNSPAGQWKKGDRAVKPYAQHNCWTDAAWFFPALSSLSLTGSPNSVFSYIGHEQRNGLSLEHVREFQRIAGDSKTGVLSRLSTMDFYLDPTSFLPLIVDFKLHPDNDLTTNLQAEVLFSDYKVVSGVNIPFHVQRVVNGTVDLDVVITNATINTGLSTAVFSLQ